MLALPRSWMMALDFSLGAAGGAGLASMHEPVGRDGGPSACQRVLAAFGAILEPYDPHRRLVILSTYFADTWLLLLLRNTAMHNQAWAHEPWAECT